MKERGMIFNADMVRAVLNGSKTQTRRMLTPRHLELIGLAARSGECYPLESGQQHANSQSYYCEFCPFGAVGDRLWVRETFSVVPRTAYAASEGVQQVICPDDSHEAAIFRAGWEHSSGGIRWRPSIHMPRWASRITLEITGVRVERLQDISEADAKAEGAPAECCVIGDKHFLGFRSLWRSIYEEESWQANPWVWVIEFKRVEGE